MLMAASKSMGSQTHPTPFGYAVAKLSPEYRAELTRGWMRTHLGDIHEITLDELMGCGTLVDTWGDADLHPVLELLMRDPVLGHQVHEIKRSWDHAVPSGISGLPAVSLSLSL